MDALLSTQLRESLRDALGEAQRIGMLGSEPLETVIERSVGFVRRIPEGAHSLIDLGSGGGDPGLVIAASCPSLAVTLVDRRAKRTDLLARLVGRLALSSRVDVVEADVADLQRLFPNRTWDVASSRGFGDPEYTARHAAPLLRLGGCLIVSEPPESAGERWQEVPRFGLELESVEFGVARLIKTF